MTVIETHAGDKRGGFSSLMLSRAFLKTCVTESKISAFKEALFDLEDDLQMKGILVGVAPEEMVGVQLSPEFYDDNGVEKVKIIITVECVGDVSEIDDDLAEEISDTVSDWLKSQELDDIADSAGINAELIDWYPVLLEKV